MTGVSRAIADRSSCRTFDGRPLAAAERRYIEQALERAGGVQTQAAKLLGVTFRSLRYRMGKLGLAPQDEEM